jgi:hypothetical protein
VTVGLTFPLGSPFGTSRAAARREPHAEVPRRGPRRRASVEHAPWCVQHGPAGCQGQVFSLPGTTLLLWLSAPSTDDPRLVVEGPDGVVELPVEA